MFDYFDKKLQAQINKKMETPAMKYKPDGHDIKGKGNKDQFDFNTEIFLSYKNANNKYREVIIKICLPI